MGNRLADVLESVLQAMQPMGPGKLENHLRFMLEEREVVADVGATLEYIRAQIAQGDPNSQIHRVFAKHLRSWDFAAEPTWANRTVPLSAERRGLVCELLALDAETVRALSASTPVAVPLNEAVLIAEEHEKWYTDERKRRTGNFYWSRYKEYLEAVGGWTGDSTEALDRATEKVIRCLSDPERSDAFAARGLVVGYVQSGKTANFTAVIAKALDAGYRMIVVLAGTLDSLRLQTQRRLDKELCGREQILRDADDGQPHEYSGDKDWDRFTSYGSLPSQIGGCDIRRITTSSGDYRGLGQGRDVLKIERVYNDRPLNHPANLRAAAARLIVIKKNPAVIRKLVRDLKTLKHPLGDVPVLVIDDESDQASVNTVDPKKVAEGKAKKDRTSTNQAIVDLLGFLPRSQYVGYTATPAANALINPGDSQDLFPKHFIELLPRPDNYMGVSDFHDFDSEFNPLDDEDIERLEFLSKKRAFVRQISSAQESEKLKEALDAFFLAGAIKLFRYERNAYALSIRHHTMLVHRASQQDAHEEDCQLVRDLIAENKYRKSSSIERLWRLWKENFEPVSLAQEPGLVRPESLEQLQPFLIESLERFEKNRKQVLIVNGRQDYKDDMPDFDKDNVWNILVGGAKLSRGYTVEGLTTTFFLRKAGAGDTLMQMGRWFGFRRGYRDLVRLYIGTQVPAGKTKTVDLYEMFESICMDEERFRKRIEIYSDQNITPSKVPPLVPMGMLLPTQKNKMHFAEIRFENFGGRVAESGRVALKAADRRENVQLLKSLLHGMDSTVGTLVGRAAKDQVRQSLYGGIHRVDARAMKKFLMDYRWGTRESQFAGVISFLDGSGDAAPGINSWLVTVLDKPSASARWAFSGRDFGVFERAMVGVGEGDRYKVISESRHRAVAKHLVDVEALLDANQLLRDNTVSGQAVCLVYPTVPVGFTGAAVKDEDVTVGLSLVFPANSIKQKIDWQVGQPERELRDVDRSAGDE